MATHRYQGLRLEQTIPPPPPRTPSPALQNSSPNSANRPSYTPMMASSSWEYRGHRSPPAAQSPFPAERERNARSVSPRHNMRPEPLQRTRTPPALEPAPLRISHHRTPQSSSPTASIRVYTDRSLQPSDAERRRAAEQQQQQKSRPQLLTSNANHLYGLASPPPERPLPALPFEATARKGSDAISPKTLALPAFSPLTSSYLAAPQSQQGSHIRQPSAGEANLMKIGAPRPRRVPRANVPSMCDYPSLAELEGLWAQQDCFLGSVTAPQGDRSSTDSPLGINMHPALRGVVA